jgi:hypothetical protein
MQSSDYEKFIEGYILSDRSHLIAPQYAIRAAVTERIPDLLVASMRERIFYLVEITKDQHPTRLEIKLKDYATSSGYIANGLSKEFALDRPWDVKPWIFVWRDLHARHKQALQQYPVKITYLEDVMHKAEKGVASLNREYWPKPVVPDPV